MAGRNAAKRFRAGRRPEAEPAVAGLPEGPPLWALDIVELTGHNLEARGREEVNRLLQSGWRLLHVYTLKYREDGVWRERPMAILGRLRNPPDETGPADRVSSATELAANWTRRKP